MAGFCAQLCTPKLTTIHQPVELIAEAALGFLVSRIADAATPAREVTIDAPLIRRGPTGKSCIDNFWLFFALVNVSLIGCCSKGKNMKTIKDKCLLMGADWAGLPQRLLRQGDGITVNGSLSTVFLMCTVH